MTGHDDELTAEALAKALAGRGLGNPLEVYPVAVTTDSLAIAWARSRAAPEGALVVAEQELSPRGRRGPAWTSVAGKSLAFSVVLRPALPPEAEGLLWLLSSLTAAEGVEELLAGARMVAVKWPNDLLVGDRRLGAVRVDAHLGPGQIESAVLTVRINVSIEQSDVAPALAPLVTSITAEGVTTSRGAVLSAILEHLERRYDADPAELLEAYRRRCSTIGRRVRAHLMPVGEAAGIARDVDEAGRLQIEGFSRPVSVDVLRRLDVE